MDKIKEALYPYRMAIIIGLVFLVAFVGIKIFTGIKSIEKNTDEPVVKLEATNDNTYNNINEIKIEDFVVKGIHKDDVVQTLSVEDVTLNTEKSKPVGKTVEVEIYYNKDKNISCTCEVNIKREKIMGFQCGYPTVTDVIAVLYSNGELCFEGEGDVLVFYEGQQPWLSYEEDEKCPVLSVSFDKKVTPTNMNYWFEGLTTLTYVDTIPSTVRTMVRTFNGCTNMRAMADWTKADSLLNINETYKGCTSLVKTSPVPKRVRIAKSTCEGCTELQVSADHTGAVSLVNTTAMYKGCNKLIQINMPPNVTDMTEMFENCINLKQMPELPESIVVMTNSFANDTNLTGLTNIPENVDDLSGTFRSCEMITGEMRVYSNPHKYSGMFQGAALATKVNLTGDSLLLDVMANTSDTANIYVNKSKPNPSLKEYTDVFVNKN